MLTGPCIGSSLSLMRAAQPLMLRPIGGRCAVVKREHDSDSGLGRWALAWQVTIRFLRWALPDRCDSVLEMSFWQLVGVGLFARSLFCGPSDAEVCRLGLPLAVVQASLQIFPSSFGWSSPCIF